MKYFIDTEFLEGPQNKTLFGISYGKTKPTIDLISIGIVAEDGRDYYAISKEFNLKEAWNRFDWKRKKVHDGIPGAYKVYWIRENVLKPIWVEKCNEGFTLGNSPMTPKGIEKLFTYKNFKKIINKYGKTNKQIAEEIKEFVYNRGFLFADSQEQVPLRNIGTKYTKSKIEFYRHYSDYDWVVFCWLFGRMIDLPEGFPMFAFDIQQQIEEYKIDKELLLKEVPQINSHNSLSDAFWNKNAYEWIQNKISNEKG